MEFLFQYTHLFVTCSVTSSHIATTFPAKPTMAPMAASTIKAQMRPYSTAVAPRCEPHSPLHRLIIGKPHFCAFSQVTIRANSLNKIGRASCREKVVQYV